MMYKENVVACIKVSGKILRENKDLVSLPFGTEYSILIKNMNSARIKVRVDIDGKEASTWVIIGANSSVELERFFTNGNLKQGNKFKFIERTAQIEEHRGIQAEDGLIRIEYALEKITSYNKVVVKTEYEYPYYYPYSWPYRNSWPYRSYPWSGYTLCNNVQNSVNSSYGGSPLKSSGGSGLRAMNCSASLSTSGNFSESAFQTVSDSDNDAGITVPGSISDQSFEYASGFETHPSEIIVLRLKGYIGKEKVVVPIDVYQKKHCTVCGKSNKYINKFCNNCGTCLTII